jgi:hypothetical protein
MYGIEQFPKLCDVSVRATPLPVYIRRPLMCTRERRLEEHIRELCATVVAEQEADELKRVITELQAALREHVERLRQRVAARLCRPTSEVPPEKRKPSG